MKKEKDKQSNKRMVSFFIVNKLRCRESRSSVNTKAWGEHKMEEMETCTDIPKDLGDQHKI